MKNKLLSLLLLALFSSVFFVGYAQEDNTEQTETKKKKKAEKEAFYLGKFGDNWFITAGGGVDFYFSELDGQAAFKDRWGETYRLGFGKLFLPGYGFRLQVAGGKAHVLGSSPTALSEPYKNGLYRNSFNYINLNLAAFFNFMDLIGGYKSERVYSVIPYFSAGVVRSFHTDWSSSENDEMSLSIGVMNYFRLSKRFGLSLEAEAIVQRTDAYKKTNKGLIGRNIDLLFPVTLNLQYNIRPGFKKITCMKAESASELENLLKEKNAEIERLKATSDIPLVDTVYVEKIKMVQAATLEAADATPNPVYAVFFKLGKADIESQQRITLSTMSKIINKSSVNYILKGYADPETGSKQRNDVLSRSRANTVYNELVKLGVSALRLKKISFPEERPFAIQEMNRVVLIEPVGDEEAFKNDNEVVVFKNGDE